MKIYKKCETVIVFRQRNSKMTERRRKVAVFVKRKWLSHITVTLLALILNVGMLAGCGEAKDVSGELTTKVTSEPPSILSGISAVTGEWSYPIEKDVKLSFYIQGIGNLAKSGSYENYNEVPFYKGLSEKTGIPVEWQCAAEGVDNDAAYYLLLQEEVLPNIIFKNGYTASNCSMLYEDGLIYDLTPYLEKYAPDFWAYMNDSANIASKIAVTDDEGRFLFFPMIRESEFNTTYIGPVIRQDWLEECGLKAPVTLEDWETVLTAFKEKYGATLSFRLARYNNGGFASGVGAFADLKYRLYVEEGQIKCANVQPEWKEYLTVLKRWYEAGLIDPDFATNNDEAVRKKALNNQVGAMVTAMSQMTNVIKDAEVNNTGAVWVGCSYARTAEDAATKRIQTEVTLVKADTGAVITTSSTEEELIAAIQLLNYGYSEEGMMYWNFGKEGETYQLDADGNVRFTELITGDERGISEALKDYTGMYGVGVGVQMEEFLKAKNSSSVIEAVSVWIENTVAKDYIVPPYPRTEEEQAAYTDIGNVISTYVSEMALKFVTGGESLDSFEKFVEQLNAYKLPELLEMEQAAYDRYINR